MAKLSKAQENALLDERGLSSLRESTIHRLYQHGLVETYDHPYPALTRHGYGVRLTAVGRRAQAEIKAREGR